MKRYGIVHLNNYMYVVDRNPIRIGATFSVLGTSISDGFDKVAKIIASNDPSLELPLLPQIEEDDRASYLKAFEQGFQFAHGNPSNEMYFRFNTWWDQNKAAKAKKYTEEDMRNAIKIARQCVAYSEAANGKEWTEVEFYHEEDEIIKSFNPLPVAVEVEMEYEFKNTPDQQQWQEMSHSEKMEYAVPTVPKIVKNIIQVKRWIYEETI